MIDVLVVLEETEGLQIHYINFIVAKSKVWQSWWFEFCGRSPLSNHWAPGAREDVLRPAKTAEGRHYFCSTSAKPYFVHLGQKLHYIRMFGGAKTMLSSLLWPAEWNSQPLCIRTLVLWIYSALRFEIRTMWKCSTWSRRRRADYQHSATIY